jgi:arylsulfatase A-like enzyme
MGQAIPADLSGQSFLRELRGHGSTAPRAAVSGFMQTWRTIGVGRYKLLQRSPENMTLYDVAKDPGEKADLAESQPLALRYTRGLLGLMLDGERTQIAAVRKKRVHKEENTTIDAETEAQLRALGYVGSSRR